MTASFVRRALLVAVLLGLLAASAPVAVSVADAATGVDAESSTDGVAAGSSTAAAAENVTVAVETNRSTVPPGGPVAASVTVSVTDRAAPGLDLDLPSGWTVAERDDDGGFYRSDGHQWVWNDAGDVDRTVELTLVSPSDASGEAVVAAEGSAIDPETNARDTDTTSTTISFDDADGGHGLPAGDDGGTTGDSDASPPDDSDADETGTTAPDASDADGADDSDESGDDADESPGGEGDDAGASEPSDDGDSLAGGFTAPALLVAIVLTVAQAALRCQGSSSGP